MNLSPIYVQPLDKNTGCVTALPSMSDVRHDFENCVIAAGCGFPTTTPKTFEHTDVGFTTLCCRSVRGYCLRSVPTVRGIPVRNRQHPEVHHIYICICTYDTEDVIFRERRPCFYFMVKLHMYNGSYTHPIYSLQ